MRLHLLLVSISVGAEKIVIIEKMLAWSARALTGHVTACPTVHPGSSTALSMEAVVNVVRTASNATDRQKTARCATRASFWTELGTWVPVWPTAKRASSEILQRHNAWTARRAARTASTSRTAARNVPRENTFSRIRASLTALVRRTRLSAVFLTLSSWGSIPRPRAAWKSCTMASGGPSVMTASTWTKRLLFVGSWSWGKLWPRTRPRDMAGGLERSGWTIPSALVTSENCKTVDFITVW